MNGEKLLLLENAAKDLMSPPYAVTEEKRREAEAIFLDLKKTQRPYDTCKFILENTTSDYVLFQAGSTVRDGVIREWELLSGDERVSLRGYLLQYITSRPDLVSYVREQLVQTVALMVKRATLEEDRRTLFDSVFTTVSQLLLTDDSKMRQLSCSLLSALLTEFSNSSGSSNIGLPIEFHVKCKIAIQDEELLRILVFTVQYLRQYVSVDLPSLPPSHLSLLSDFLRLLSKILNWDFQITKFSPVPLNISDVATVTLRPPRTYAATFLDPSFLDLLFSLLGKMWCNEDLLHHLTQGLTQLASLTKPVLASNEEQKTFLGSFVSGLLGYISTRVELTQQEIYGLSCILRRLATNFPPSLFSSLPPPQLSLLVSSLTQLTCLTAHKSATEEEGSEEGLMYFESLEHFLEVFVNFLSEPDPLPPSLLTQPSVQVFNSYLKSKLVAPRGWRNPQREEGEIFELEEDDREAFSDQLRSVGCIARSVPHHSLPLLVQTIHQCTESCMERLGAIQSDPTSLYSLQNNLDSTYEDLHWLVLISAFTLCDITRGEEVEIPANLMSYSIQRHKEMGSESVVTGDNLSQLVWQEEGDGQIDLSSSHLDPIISLFLSLCRLCMVEKMFVGRGLMEVVSPQLGSTVVWCLSQVVHPYIHFSEDSYNQVSLPLLSVFGKDSPPSQWLCVFLLDKVTFNLSVWSGEETVAVDTVGLLGSLVKNTDRASVVVKCEMIWSLMKGFSSGGPVVAALPPRVQRDLICSLVRCAVGQSRQLFLSQLLGPLRERFSSLVGSPNLKGSQDPVTIRELLSLLEALCGLALNSRPALMQEVFDYLLPLLQASVQLLEVYSGTPEVIGVILELFALSAENYIVFLSQEHTLELYKVCLDLIHAYTSSNTGRYRGTGLDLDEEESCEDLLQFLKMMTHLTVKDYVDFGNTQEGESMKPVDVVIAGLNTILPLMTTEILKFPTLCRQFYILVNYICESCPEKLPTLPHQLFLTLMNQLESGLHNYGPEVRVLCLESIEGVASCHARAEPPTTQAQTLTEVLQHFLKVIFDQMLSSSFDMDTIHSTSAAVYAIICYHKELYLSLANSLISSQTDPHNQSRLMEAFSLLTPPSLPLDSKRTSKITFRKNLEHFLPFVKGFLCYK